jgi:hypothetical protein
MRDEVYKGAKCRVIGSANGPKGLTIGRIVTAMFPYTDRPPHTLHGQIWRIQAADGKGEFMTEHGGIGPEVDVAEDWLEVLRDDPEPPKAEEREKDLVVSSGEDGH